MANLRDLPNNDILEVWRDTRSDLAGTVYGLQIPRNADFVRVFVGDPLDVASDFIATITINDHQHNVNIVSHVLEHHDHIPYKTLQMEFCFEFMKRLMRRLADHDPNG
jgi:hypothetical protein